MVCYSIRMDFIRTSKAKLAILVGAILFFVAFFIYDLIVWLIAPYAFVAMSFLLIILPLCTGLFLYKGKLSYVFLGVAVFSSLSGLIVLTDLSATRNTAEVACTRFMEGRELIASISYTLHCAGVPGAEGHIFNMFSSDLGKILFWPMLLCLLLSVCNIILAPMYILISKLKKNQSKNPSLR